MFVSMVAGAVFVVIFGIIMMLVLYAGNLDTLLMVSPAVTDICCIAFLLLLIFSRCVGAVCSTCFILYSFS